MKILFIAENGQVDYLPNCVLNGLYHLQDVEVHLSSDLWYLFEGNSLEKTLKLYGKGFSVTNGIPIERKNVLPSATIQKRICSHYYDVVIYGSVHRCLKFHQEVLKYYKPSEIVYLDGEDQNFDLFHRAFSLFGKDRLKALRHIDMKRNKEYYNLARQLLGTGIYFKRELRDVDADKMLPISFAIPEERIVQHVPEKSRKMAYIIPGKLDTYIYTNETDYYKGYQIAGYGVTCQKAGWDCMRHYEILANGCIPYFVNMERCPKHTMVNFPKNIIMQTNHICENRKKLDSEYYYYAEYLLDYTKRYLTTRELAKYVLNKVL